MPALVEIITSEKRYGAPGRCIYCGRKAVKLTREHIIPHGLAGDSLVFLMASCIKCAKKTGAHENACLRHMWWPFRYHLGAPAKEAPKDFELKRIAVTAVDGHQITAYDKLSAEKLHPDLYPAFFYTFKFHPPSILTGIAHDLMDHGLFALVDEKTIAQHALGDKQGFRLGPAKVPAFCAMLAKIAHAYAAAELGLGAFHAELTTFIRALAPFNLFHWIGGEMEPPPATDAFHEIGIRLVRSYGSDYVVVRLRLFAYLGTPLYDVVVGRLEPSFNDFSLFERPLYRIDIEPPFPLTHLVPKGFNMPRTGS